MKKNDYKQLWEHLYPIIYRMMRNTSMDTQNPYDPAEEARNIVQDAIIIVFKRPPNAIELDKRLKYAKTTSVRLFYAWYKKRFPSKDIQTGDDDGIDPTILLMHIDSDTRRGVAVTDQNSEDGLEMEDGFDISDTFNDTTKMDRLEIVISCLDALPQKIKLVMEAYIWAISPLHFRKDINLNEAIVERIQSTTGQTFTPESIGVDRSRGIKLLQESIKRRYPNA
jgi:DNA-directed RNA polymerase specialized sigma24 family protein